MSDKRSTAKRILRSKDKEPFIQSLLSEECAVFREIWRLLLFAAQVGVQNQRREPLALPDSAKGIDQATFGNCPSWPGILYLMALVETKSPDALSGGSQREDTRIQMFQEYANGGLAIMAEFFADRNIDQEGVLAFIDLQTQKDGKKPVDLDHLI